MSRLKFGLTKSIVLFDSDCLQRQVEEDYVVKQAEAETLAAYTKAQAILAQAKFASWMMVGAIAAVAVAGIFAYRRFKN